MPRIRCVRASRYANKRDAPKGKRGGKGGEHGGNTVGLLGAKICWLAMGWKRCQETRDGKKGVQAMHGSGIKGNNTNKTHAVTAEQKKGGRESSTREADGAGEAEA